MLFKNSRKRIAQPNHRDESIQKGIFKYCFNKLIPISPAFFQAIDSCSFVNPLAVFFPSVFEKKKHQLGVNAMDFAMR